MMWNIPYIRARRILEQAQAVGIGQTGAIPQDLMQQAGMSSKSIIKALAAQQKQAAFAKLRQ